MECYNVSVCICNPKRTTKNCCDGFEKDFIINPSKHSFGVLYFCSSLL